MVDWGFLSPIYNLGGQVGQIIYNAGAATGAAVSTPPPAQQGSGPQLSPLTGGSGGSGSNPVTMATDFYNTNYSYTTPRADGGVNKYNPTPFAIPSFQSLESTPAVRSSQPVGWFQDAGALGLPAPFKSIAAAPAMGSMMSPIDMPRGQVAQPTYQTPQQKGQSFFVPYGEQRQQEIQNAKMVYAPTSGMVGFYQTPKSIYEDQGFVRKYGFETSGGGPGALQSGMFSAQPLTPAVYTQESGGTKFAPSANPLAAADILRNPEKYSRLGAEAYGGFVQPLDNRVLSPDVQMGRYSQGGNLANLVNPYGTNEPKSSWETVPWQIETKGAPAIQSVDISGKLSAPMMIAKADMGITPAPGVLDAGAMGLPLPFRSRDTGAATPQPTFQETAINALQSSIRSGLSTGPFMPLAIASDMVFSIGKGKPDEIPFAELYKSASSRNIGQAYEDLNKGLAPYTTDISGIGKTLSQTKDVQGYGVAGDVLNFAKGVYIGASQHPVDIAITFAGGEALSYGEGLTKMGVARAAESGLPVLGTLGRAASSPVAADVFGIGKTAIGAYIIGAAGLNILAQPTATGKGEATGRTAIQFAGFGAGMGNIAMPEPQNQYAGRGFFSGQPEIGPIEKLQFKAETTIRSYLTEQPGAYREVATMVIPGRTIEPPIRAEPEFGSLTRSGEYATEIKGTLMEQPHSVIGSSTIIQQYPSGIAERAGLRVGKDVDALIQSPSKGISDLMARTGLPEIEAKSVLDLHVIPAKYPGLKASIELESTTPESSSLTDAFGNPYRSIAFPRGTSEVITPGMGEMTYESGQVGFGRKGAAVSVFLENPIGKGYRGEKDIYDFVTEYGAQKAVGLSQGLPESRFAASDKALESFMGREFTYGTVKGQKIGDENPTITRSVLDIYTDMFQKAGESRATARAGGEAPGLREPFTESGVTPSRGYISDFIRSATPSGIVSSDLASDVFGSSPLSSPVKSGMPVSPFSPGKSASDPLSAFTRSTLSGLTSPSTSPSTYKTPSFTPPSDIGFPSPSFPGSPSFPPSTPTFPSIFPPSSPPTRSQPPSFPPWNPSPPSRPPTTTIPPSFPPRSPPPLMPPTMGGFGFQGIGTPLSTRKGRFAFQERFRISEGIRFNELGVGSQKRKKRGLFGRGL